MRLESPQTARRVYIVLVVLIILGIPAVLLLRDRLPELLRHVPSHRAHYDVGLYCPGCGGTRACVALTRGHILRSFLYHPAVPYTAGGILAFVLNHTLSLLTRGRVRAWRVRPYFFYILAGIILMQWIVKLLVVWVGGWRPI